MKVFKAKIFFNGLWEEIILLAEDYRHAENILCEFKYHFEHIQEVKEQTEIPTR